MLILRKENKELHDWTPDIFQELYVSSCLTGKFWQSWEIIKVNLNDKSLLAKVHNLWKTDMKLFQLGICLELLFFGLLFFPVCAPVADQGCLGSKCPLQICFSVGHGTRGIMHANHINSMSQWDDWQSQSFQARWHFALFNSELPGSGPHPSWSYRSPCLSNDDWQPLSVILVCF